MEFLAKARRRNPSAVTQIFAEYNARIEGGWSEAESAVLRNTALKVVALLGTR